MITELFENVNVWLSYFYLPMWLLHVSPNNSMISQVTNSWIVAYTSLKSREVIPLAKLGAYVDKDQNNNKEHMSSIKVLQIISSDIVLCGFFTSPPIIQ